MLPSEGTAPARLVAFAQIIAHRISRAAASGAVPVTRELAKGEETMADLNNREAQRAGGAAAGTATGTTTGVGDWATEEKYWRENFSSRPYVRTDRGVDYYRPGYRYGFESANRYRGKQWNEMESDLRTGWDRFEHRGQSKWEDLKEAVRDAWNRVTGR
jgi:hypothetical protein